MASTILNIAVGFFLALVGLALTALVVGERKSLRKNSDDYHTMGKLLRVLLVILFLFVATILGLSYWVSLWFFIALIPSLLFTLPVIFPNKQRVGAALTADNPAYGSKNKYFTREDYEESKNRLTRRD